jgi:Tfp pilus assembly protein PilF
MGDAMTFSSSPFRASILAGITLLTSAAIAQRGSNPGAGSRTSPSSRAPATPDVSAQPVFLSGKVLLEGGGALPESVAIERICNSIARREGYTDFKGQFQIQIGGNLTFQDASENDPRIAPNAQSSRSGSGLARRPNDLTGCELRAVVAGYQSSLLPIHTTGDTWQVDVGTIFIKRMGNATGTTISLTSMSAPQNAMRAYEKALRVRQEKPAEAEKELHKAVQAYPQFAAAWNLLGDIHRQEEKFDLARDEYGKAVFADPQFVNPAYGLALIAMQEKKWEEGIRLTDQVLKMNSAAFPLTYFFNAAANYNLQKYDAAEESARKFKAVDTQHEHPDVCLLLSNVYARKKDYAGAAREIREFLAAMPNAPDAEALNTEAKRFEELSVSAKRD